MEGKIGVQVNITRVMFVHRNTSEFRSGMPGKIVALHIVLFFFGEVKINEIIWESCPGHIGADLDRYGPLKPS